MPVLLLLLFSLALSIGLGLIVVLVRRATAGQSPVRDEEATPAAGAGCPYEHSCVFRRPGCWLAVRSRNLLAVQSALGLQHAKPCSWTDALVSEQKLFISPPVKGWILVLGSDLPDPGADIDQCFRFVVTLSRRLGQVQFFSASRILNHHAWVKADGGRILRAYAWAGTTLWQQGECTPAEADLGLKCFGYTESPDRRFDQPDVLAVNTDKVPQLAARWSVDPGQLDEPCLQAEPGIAGEPRRRY
jgi:hypothetical protein